MCKKLNIVCLTVFLLALTAQHTSAVIVVNGDFVSGPAGSPPTSTDPAFWTGGGDPNSDPNVAPSTDGIVGVTSDGALTISAGSGLNLNHLDLGQNPDAAGTVNVSGAGSTLNVGVHFHIGTHADDASTLDGGNGILNITSGGVVDVGSDIWLGDSATSTGTAIVDGAGSILWTGDDLWLGDDGMGSLTVRNGGLVEVADVTDVGDEPGGRGILIVDGVGSIFRSRDLDIGDDGNGQGTVTNGARVEVSDDIQIANDTSGDLSSLTVQGANSTVTATDLIRVGDEARGTLSVSDGARVEGGKIYVGGNEAGVGTMTIEGAGTTVVANAGSFTSGLSGQGHVTVKDGGRIEANVVRLGDNDSGVGVITAQGANSTIVSTDSYLVGHFGSGNLTVSDGARAEAGGTFFLGLQPGGVGHVTVQGAGSTLETIGGSIEIGPQGGNGRLSVLDGAQATALATVSIGAGAGSDGWVNVSGAGSQLSSAFMIVGGNGRGVLNVFDGGQATASTDLAVGESSSGGIVNVRGIGSQISAPNLNLGVVGSGTLNVSESGSASFETATVSATGTVNMVVSSNNMLTATTSYTNDGTTNFIAGSQLSAGSYTPIDSQSFLGQGSYAGVGGTTSFLSGVPIFTTGPIMTDDGDGIEMSLNGGDRVQFGNVMVALNENAGFGGSLTVTELGLLTFLGREALLAFSFEASGLNTDLLNALSFNVGQQDRDTIRIFQRATGASDNAWLAFDPTITDYTNESFMFTVNEFNGFDFAIVAIPEPSGFLCVGLAAAASACTRWKRRGHA